HIVPDRVVLGDGLDQADEAFLAQVVKIHGPGVVAADDVADHGGVLADQLLFRLPILLPDPLQQLQISFLVGTDHRDHPRCESSSPLHAARRDQKAPVLRDRDKGTQFWKLSRKELAPSSGAHRGSTINRMAVRSSPSISISANAGIQIRSMPLGATKPRLMAIALIA